MDSGIFQRVIVSTDSAAVADICRHYGAEVPFLRPSELAGDKSPDIEWILHAIGRIQAEDRAYDAFSILRPTSPFRLPHTIQRAWQSFLAAPGADSLRAVELCEQHPGKMWRIAGEYMEPLLNDGGVFPPWHSTPYQALPKIYVQNASLEMAWWRVPLTTGSIAGKQVLPFITEALEGFDINYPEDWVVAQYYIDSGAARLPLVGQDPCMGSSVS